ncbi:hypothetical protein ABB37_04137 [Leptomonas pyrrhocoris]|uniref:Thioesterase domain-containing protein n=1 Tax=Leptomonas pyrrhocoris TaxID=157538 RepID=A0A0N0DWK6_LEPPY|nr:hypothetical protein ABB37_04137 [Leptomonas pyrrhocoris]XP_015660330.1 hypothetical protein ABB37_04137 [Leptomonas pyrrhocoris]XP_015660331.1 hypothetical protein ABB37_04137 [Leptomonas pyrrhocoris]XP_015660332.1 hypothetical protein ABB37_04137 [Leptomonas pyrrhocoris]KPA81890.1 hypothetical protein ABB37_04137 [Leptomonas pyrrhocoris]KPA81891.1 hypothetical protein ABB37_04137 [Leptomonas pyrrhocoris]KPA81892.1 hypothetical protein ABB37_04137 [Leptomonas pyrrhocoris]KPA81893.1 hypot|eukprot:XP_015660329.1 hypothetical protein ABB37_04137 [Leptomonas pyrrhocoris]
MMQATRFALNSVAIQQATAAARRVMDHPQNYTTHLLSTVLFSPDLIRERPEGTLVFPWRPEQGCRNGFKSVHGGAISTLADAFTKMHVRAYLPDKPVKSVSFDISFLSAVFENTKCSCVTRLVHQSNDIVFTDFSFEDEDSGAVYARGTHVLSTGE